MNVILRLFLNSGNATDLILPLAAAEKILNEWREFGPKLGIFVGTTADGVKYAVQAEDVSILLILPYRESRQQQPVQQTIPLHGTPWFPARA